MPNALPAHLYYSVPMFFKREKHKAHRQLHKGRDFHLNTINLLCAGLKLSWQTVEMPTVGPRCPLGPALPAIP